MMKQTANSLHWNMTTSTDDRVVYLCAMRNLKVYCKKGFCDFYLAAYRFSDYPKSLALRMLKPFRSIPPMTFDWNDREGVYDFLFKFFVFLTKVYHTKLNRNDFESAFEEFSQYLLGAKK